MKHASIAMHISVDVKQKIRKTKKHASEQSVGAQQPRPQGQLSLCVWGTGCGLIYWLCLARWCMADASLESCPLSVWGAFGYWDTCHPHMAMNIHFLVPAKGWWVSSSLLPPSRPTHGFRPLGFLPFLRLIFRFSGFLSLLTVLLLPAHEISGTWSHLCASVFPQVKWGW